MPTKPDVPTPTLEERIAEARKVQIITRKLTQEELNAFVDYVSKLPEEERAKGVSFASYVKETFYKERSTEKDFVVVPDITGLEFIAKKTGLTFKYTGIDTGAIDLKAVDFTGSIINGVKFINCNLTNSVFCECDMNDVYFDESILAHADFRGAILIGATLGPSYDFIGQRAAELEVRGLEFIPEEHIDSLSGKKRRSDSSLDYEERSDSEIESETREAQHRNFQKEKEAASAREREVQAREKALIGGAKFDTTLSLAYTYKREHTDEKSKQKAQAQKEFEKAVTEKEKELADKRQSIEDRITKRREEVGVVSSFLWGDKEIGERYRELEKHKEEDPKTLEEFTKKAHKELAAKYFTYREDSFVRAFHHLCEFDPCYKRGSTPEERNKKHIYIDTSVEDVKAYLLEIKEHGKENLTLNEFVRARENTKRDNRKNTEKPLLNPEFARTGPTPYDHIPDDVIVHADCSSPLYPGSKPKDFSKMIFDSAHLQGVSFAGSNLDSTKFNNTDISNSSFESCSINDAEFTQTIARGANFFRASIQGTKISKNSDFTNTILIKANATGAKIDQTNLSKTKGQYIILDKTAITDSILDFADLTSASLINATFTKTSMIGIRLDNAVLDHCKMETCNLREASLKNVKARFAKFHGVQLQKIEAMGAEFSSSYFGQDALGAICDLEGAELDNAIMKAVELYKVNLTKASMNFVDLEGSKIKDTIMDDAKAKFINLNGSIIENLKAHRIDITGGMLQGIKKLDADFTGGILRDIQIEKSNIDKLVLDQADICGAKFKENLIKELSIKKAKVNTHTELPNDPQIKIKGADDLIEEIIQPDDQVIEVPTTLKALNEKIASIKDAQSKGFIRKTLGNLLERTGIAIKKAGEFIQQPFSDKIGLKTGAIVGLVIALLVVASVAAPLIPGAWLATPFITTTIAVANLIPGVGILTSSIALAAVPVKMLTTAIGAAAPTLFTAIGINVSVTAIPIIATATAATIATLASVAGGALTGRYVVQHIKLSHIAAATTGFATGLASGFFLGPLAPLAGVVGAGVGVISAVTANTASEKLTGLTGGRTLDDLASSGIKRLSDLTKNLGERVGITPQQATLLEEHARYKQADRQQYAQKLATEQAAKAQTQKEKEVAVNIKELPPSVLASGQVPQQSTGPMSMQDQPIVGSPPITALTPASQVAKENPKEEPTLQDKQPLEERHETFSKPSDARQREKAPTSPAEEQDKRKHPDELSIAAVDHVNIVSLSSRESGQESQQQSTSPMSMQAQSSMPLASAPPAEQSIERDSLSLQKPDIGQSPPTSIVQNPRELSSQSDQRAVERSISALTAPTEQLRTGLPLPGNQFSKESAEQAKKEAAEREKTSPLVMRSDSDQPIRESVPAPSAPTKKPMTILQTLAMVKYKQLKKKHQEASQSVAQEPTVQVHGNPSSTNSSKQSQKTGTVHPTAVASLLPISGSAQDLSMPSATPVQEPVTVPLDGSIPTSTTSEKEKAPTILKEQTKQDRATSLMEDSSLTLTKPKAISRKEPSTKPPTTVTASVQQNSPPEKIVKKRKKKKPKNLSKKGPEVPQQILRMIRLALQHQKSKQERQAASQPTLTEPKAISEKGSEVPQESVIAVPPSTAKPTKIPPKNAALLLALYNNFKQSQRDSQPTLTEPQAISEKGSSTKPTEKGTAKVEQTNPPRQPAYDKQEQDSVPVLAPTASEKPTLAEILIMMGLALRHKKKMQERQEASQPTSTNPKTIDEEGSSTKPIEPKGTANVQQYSIESPAKAERDKRAEKTNPSQPTHDDHAGKETILTGKQLSEERIKIPQEARKAESEKNNPPILAVGVRSDSDQPKQTSISTKSQEQFLIPKLFTSEVQKKEKPTSKRLLKKKRKDKIPKKAGDSAYTSKVASKKDTILQTPPEKHITKVGSLNDRQEKAAEQAARK